tara:strand:- start:4139 stop:5419 length:1281 start_codon:yes stop_codon:yes gene_type:complete
MSQALSVSSLVSSVKQSLEGEYSFVSVVGEVSNLSRSSAGHIYFTLSDKDSGLSAVLFKGDALRNTGTRTLKDGDKITCHGGLSVYTKRGTFQLVVRRFEAAGSGDLKEQYEKLKRELAGQGLFDPEAKKQIPHFPKRVAVITAEGGAALQDFLNVYRRRALSGEVVVIPAVVQGQASAQSLRNALAKAIKHGLSSSALAFDVIVLTRGGGSMEDLWSFNDEGLAWDIYNCPIPIISAVGHQVDYTICDYVSDLRCETPTAAAQILTQYQTEVSANLGRIKAQLLHSSLTLKARGPERLKELSPNTLVAILRDRMNLAARRLRECRIDDKIERLSGFNELSLRLDDCSRKLVTSEQRRVEQLSFKIEKLGNMMSALNPKQVLNRGYTYVSDDSHKVVSNKASWNKLAKEQELNLHFSDGPVKIKRS